MADQAAISDCVKAIKHYGNRKVWHHHGAPESWLYTNEGKPGYIVARRALKEAQDKGVPERYWKHLVMYANPINWNRWYDKQIEDPIVWTGAGYGPQQAHQALVELGELTSMPEPGPPQTPLDS